MEVIYHELASGKDSGLTQILDCWNKKYEERYAALCGFFAPFMGTEWSTSSDCELETTKSRPKSAGGEKLSLVDLRYQFDEVLKLRATLSVEVDALEQLRAELEDTQSMSEVHIQLERATIENRRLQSALRVAHEQISDMYFNKRIMEAEMTALRSDRDTHITEANERVRMAERAVVAATARRYSLPSARGANGADTNTTTPTVTASGDSTEATGGQTATDKQTEKTTQNNMTPFRTFSSIRDRKAKDASRLRQYTTLTAMTFDDFDSLDEDDTDEQENFVVQADETNHHPQPPASPVTTPQTDAAVVRVDAQKDPINVPPIPAVVVEDRADLPAADTNTVAAAASSHAPAPSETPEFNTMHSTIDESEASRAIYLPSPTSSSTPRKSLNHESDSLATSTAAITPSSRLWESGVDQGWQGLVVEENTVPKADYLKLLDELEELRLELDAVRRTAQLKESASQQSVDVGLTGQLKSLADKVSELQANKPNQEVVSTLQTPAGATRLLDWSVSPNQTTQDSDREGEESEVGGTNSQGRQGEESQEEAKTPVAKQLGSSTDSVSSPEHNLPSPPLPRADLVFDANSRQSSVQSDGPADVETSKTPTSVPYCDQLFHSMESKILTTPFAQKMDCSTQSEFAPRGNDTGVQTELLGGMENMQMCLSDTSKTHPYHEDDGENTRVLVSPEKPLTESDVGPEAMDNFNILLNVISGETDEDTEDGENTGADMYRSGYKILAPALTQLNQEVERLATVLDAESGYHSNATSVTSHLSDRAAHEEAREREVSELRNRLSSALHLLAARLPADTQKALTETSRIVESERVQLQSELERRMVEFEQRHTASLTELESSRRTLIEQLAQLEADNMQLKDEFMVVQQKLFAKERFLDEQTEERELEREEFRSELVRLEQALRNSKSELLAVRLINGGGPSMADSGDSLSGSTIQADSDLDTTDADRSATSWSEMRPATQTRRSTIIGVAATVPPTNAAAAAADRRYSDWSLSANPVPAGRRGNRNNNSCLTDFAPPSVFPCLPSPETPREEDEARVGQPSPCPVCLDKTDVELVEAWTQLTPHLIDASMQSDFCSPMLDGAQYWTDQHSSSHDTVGTAVINSVANTTTLFVDVDTQTDPPQLGIDMAVMCSPLDDADTDKGEGADHEAQDQHTTPATSTTTTTRRIIRQLDAKAVAAYMAQVTVTEESSVVTTSYPEGEGDVACQIAPLHERFPIDVVVEMDDKGTMTEDLVAALNGQFTSLPNLTSSQSVASIPPKQPLVHQISNPTSPIPMTYECTEDKDRGLVTMVTVLVDEDNVLLHDLPTPPSPGVLLTVTTMSETIVPEVLRLDVSCCTDDMEVEVIPANELLTLMEQKNASDLLVSALRDEVQSLQDYQKDFQTDFNSLQQMLEERDLELDRYNQEALALQTRCSSLERLIEQRKNVVPERDEDIFLLTEENEAFKSKINQLEQEAKLLKPPMEHFEVQVDFNTPLLDSLKAKIGQLELAVETAEQKHHLLTTVNAGVQVNHRTPVLDSASAATEAVHDERQTSLVIDEEPQSDTLRDDDSPMHSLNTSGGVSQLGPVDRLTMVRTSTPVGEGVPIDLQSLIQRLRNESLRLFSLSTATTPVAVELVPSPTQISAVMKVDPTQMTAVENVVATSEAISEMSSNQTPSILADLVRANSAIKNAFKHLAQVIEKYETPSAAAATVKPNGHLDATGFLPTDQIQSLVRCTNEALATDEQVWLSLLQHSITETAHHASILSQTDMEGDIGSDQLVKEQPPGARLIWASINRLVNHFRTFVKHENKYRECLVQAHLVDQNCLTAQIESVLHRADQLSTEVNRLTDRLSSHKQALNRADSLNLRLSNQVTNLKSDLTTSQTEQQVTSEQSRAEVGELSSKIQENQRDKEVLQTKVASLNAEVTRLETELQLITEKFTDSQRLLSSTQKQAERVTEELQQSNNRKDTVNLPFYTDYANSTPNLIASDPPLAQPPTSSHAGVRLFADQSSVSSTCADSLLYAISRTTSNLASARQTVTKAERRARELQVANHSLRLNLAETELRLMPLLVALTRHQSSGGNSAVSLPLVSMDSLPTTTATTRPSCANPTTTERNPSARFAELKSVCSQLLSLASNEANRDVFNSELDNMTPRTAEDQDDAGTDIDDDDGEDEDEITPLRESIPPHSTPAHVLSSANARVAFDPQVSMLLSRPGETRSAETLTNGGVAPIIRVHAERDFGLEPTESGHVVSHAVGSMTARSGGSGTSGVEQSLSSHSAPMNPISPQRPIHTSSISLTTLEPTVSMERFRNVHARFLRAESYRRALTFQKRYLLLLLGGFQYSEEAVIASLGRTDSVYSDQVSDQYQVTIESADGYCPSISASSYPSPLRRFRAAARTAQVIYRMRHMVNKWRRSGLYGSPTSTSTTTNNPSNTVVTPTPPPFPPSLSIQSSPTSGLVIHHSQHDNNTRALRMPLRELAVVDSPVIRATRSSMGYHYVPITNGTDTVMGLTGESVRDSHTGKPHSRSLDFGQPASSAHTDSAMRYNSNGIRRGSFQGGPITTPQRTNSSTNQPPPFTQSSLRSPSKRMTSASNSSGRPVASIPLQPRHASSSTTNVTTTVNRTAVTTSTTPNGGVSDRYRSTRTVRSPTTISTSPSQPTRSTAQSRLSSSHRNGVGSGPTFEENRRYSRVSPGSQRNTFR